MLPELYPEFNILAPFLPPICLALHWQFDGRFCSTVLWQYLYCFFFQWLRVNFVTLVKTHHHSTSLKFNGWHNMMSPNQFSSLIELICKSILFAQIAFARWNLSVLSMVTSTVGAPALNVPAFTQLGKHKKTRIKWWHFNIKINKWKLLCLPLRDIFLHMYMYIEMEMDMSHWQLFFVCFTQDSRWSPTTKHGKCAGSNFKLIWKSIHWRSEWWIQQRQLHRSKWMILSCFAVDVTIVFVVLHFFVKWNFWVVASLRQFYLQFYFAIFWEAIKIWGPHKRKRL